MNGMLPNILFILKTLVAQNVVNRQKDANIVKYSMIQALHFYQSLAKKRC